jgi:hypothetical protein
MKISKTGTVVEAGSKWEMVSNLTANHAPFKVMGFVDSYVVMRRKNASPICAHINTFGPEYLQVCTSKEGKKQ